MAMEDDENLSLLKLPPRAFNCLARAGYSYISQVLEWDKAAAMRFLSSTRNFGIKSFLSLLDTVTREYPHIPLAQEKEAILDELAQGGVICGTFNKNSYSCKKRKA